MKKFIFVTWDGPQVNYLETLFCPIFHELKSLGYEIYIFQFTWKSEKEIIKTKNICSEYGLNYQSLNILRKPKIIGAVWTIFKGCFYLSKSIKKFQIDLVIARSILPAFVCLLIFYLNRFKFIYDSDGLILEEMIESGRIKKNGYLFKFLSKIEYFAVLNSSIVLTRSLAGSEILNAKFNISNIDKFLIVKNGRDINKFNIFDNDVRSERRRILSIAETAPVIIYIGSLGDKYNLNEMLLFFQKIRKVDETAIMFLISKSLDYFDNFTDNNLKIGVRAISDDAVDIPYFLSIADLGLALIKPTYSMKAASAIKTGEYLLCGVPVVATKGVGNISDIIQKNVGFLVEDQISELQYKQLLNWFFNYVLKNRDLCRISSRKLGIIEYSLKEAASNYNEAIKKSYSSI
jgi:glycosyltransferase involved in cell wall biosynthesis